MCILGTSQIQDPDPSRVVCVLCSFSTLSLTHAPALYSYGLLASPGTDMPYPGSGWGQCENTMHSFLLKREAMYPMLMTILLLCVLQQVSNF